MKERWKTKLKKSNGEDDKKANKDKIRKQIKKLKKMMKAKRKTLNKEEKRRARNYIRAIIRVSTNPILHSDNRVKNILGAS